MSLHHLRIDRMRVIERLIARFKITDLDHKLFIEYRLLMRQLWSECLPIKWDARHNDVQRPRSRFRPRGNARDRAHAMAYRLTS